MTLWERIASGVEVAYAKTAESDYEFFISEVLRHIKANRVFVSRSKRLADVMQLLSDAGAEERQAFLDYLVTHLDAMLVHARAQWEKFKADSTAKNDLSWWGEQLNFDEVTE